jgi:hypothetical protein
VKYFAGIHNYVPHAAHNEPPAGRQGTHLAAVCHLCWNVDRGAGQRVWRASEGSLTKSRGIRLSYIAFDLKINLL